MTNERQNMLNTALGIRSLNFKVFLLNLKKGYLLYKNKLQETMFGTIRTQFLFNPMIDIFTLKMTIANLV